MDNFGSGFIMGIMLTSIIMTIIFTKVDSCSPQAIDVYKGKTTLEITYKDSVPIDSIVVFK